MQSVGFVHLLGVTSLRIHAVCGLRASLGVTSLSIHAACGLRVSLGVTSLSIHAVCGLCASLRGDPSEHPCSLWASCIS